MTTTQVFEYERGLPTAADSDDPVHGEPMQLNMGPQHPATHGVLRLVVTLDGETMHAVEPVVGYLHRGKEKTCESLGWHKFFPHTDRLDYVQPLDEQHRLRARLRAPGQPRGARARHRSRECC